MVTRCAQIFRRARLFKEDRDTNIRRIGYVSRLLSRNGVGVIASAISPYREVRDEVRQSITSDGSEFIEVYVQCPIEVLVERDVKGTLQKSARRRD